MWQPIGKEFRRDGRAVVPVRCSCGVESVIRVDGLKSGTTRQCRACSTRGSSRALKHGHTRQNIWHPLYATWSSMIQRCEHEGHPRYADYGGRGIKVCARWRGSFADFLADVGERPEGLSLDRENNDGNYEPSNVRWATAVQQRNNRRPPRRRS